MTVLTDQGLQYINDYTFGRETDPIDTMAVGTGTAAESTGDTTLENELYRSSASNADVRFPPVPDALASTYGAIDVVGGHPDIPAETELTEIGVLVGAQDVLVYREVRSPVIAENGIETTLQVRMDDDRA